MVGVRRIVIIGGGFGGINTAQRLERQLPADWEIVLINRDNATTFVPLLPEVVGSAMLPGQVVAPIRQLLRRARFIMGTVTGVDTGNGSVTLTDGNGERTLGFEHLVIACGSIANTAIIPGMREHALPLKTAGDALAIRNAVLGRLEQAESTDAGEPERLLSVAVLGGGFSGVEVAGQIADLMHAGVRHYPSLTREQCRIVVVHNQARILPEVSAGLADKAYRRMQRQGIEFRLEAAVSAVEADGVRLDNGDHIQAATVIGTIGTAPAPLVQDLQLERARGRIVTAEDMSVPGHPGVWALGDCAAVPDADSGGTVPPTAQGAVQAARQLADNIARSLRGESTQPLRYRSQGQLATIGDQRAVAEIGRVRLAGLVAWLLWRAVYLAKFPTFGRKVRIWAEWTWSCLFSIDIAQLQFSRTDEAPAARARHDGDA